MYTIGQVAEMFGLPVSTLRYYDKQGLFPGLKRASGIRRFDDTELEALLGHRMPEEGGGEIKDIRLFRNESRPINIPPNARPCSRSRRLHMSRRSRR